MLIACAGAADQTQQTRSPVADTAPAMSSVPDATGAPPSASAASSASAAPSTSAAPSASAASSASSAPRPDPSAFAAALTATASIDGGARPRVSGLSPQAIVAVVRSHATAVRACYEIELQKNPDLKGGLQVAFVINADGSVASASIASSTLANARVEACVVRQVKSWTFPPADVSTNVGSFPFKFGVGG